MSAQPEALRLADELCEPMPGFPEPTSLEKAAGKELRRLHLHDRVLQDWLDKTDWVQETVQAGEPGMHRADVLKKRIEKLEAINQEMLAALEGVSSMSRCGQLDEFIGEPWLNAVHAAIAKATGAKA